MACLLAVNCIRRYLSDATVPDGNRELILLLYASMACSEMAVYRARSHYQVSWSCAFVEVVFIPRLRTRTN